MNFKGHAVIVENSNLEKAKEKALDIAKKRVCDNQDLDCQKCNMILNSTYLNIFTIDGKEDKIKIDQIESVKEFSQFVSVNNETKIILIEKVENITPKAANAFLKFLEEPEIDILIIFTSQNSSLVLETIRTRCQVIKLVGDSEYKLLEKVYDIKAIIDNPFHFNWNDCTKKELKEIILSVANELDVSKNKKELKELLLLPNKLEININKNIIISKIIEQIKARRL